MTDTAVLSDEDTLVNVLPYTLGYTPRESLTISAVKDHRLTYTGRFDLADLDAYGPTVALKALVVMMRRANADSSLVVVWTDTYTGEGELPYVRLLASYLVACVDIGVDITNMLCVHNGRISSYLCFDPACCPVNRPIRRTEAAEHAIAVLACHGDTLYDSREDLVAAVDPTTPVEMNTAAAIVDVDELVMMLTNADLRTLPDEQVCTVILSLSAVTLRDAFLARLGAEPVDVLQQALVVLLDTLRRTPTDWVADVAAATGILAYLVGNGVIAEAALNRVFAANPDHTLAKIARKTLRYQVTPSALREILTSYKEA